MRGESIVLLVEKSDYNDNYSALLDDVADEEEEEEQTFVRGGDLTSLPSAL